MKATTALCLAIAVAAFAGPANAIFKCTTAKGVVYQDRPCRDGNESDLTIVIPTGELAPRGFRGGGRRRDGEQPALRRPGQCAAGLPQPWRASRATRSAERRTSDSAANGARRSLQGPSPVWKSAVPTTADQARKADPSAKYYATEGFNAGGDTPAQMNCESPSGEKRVFYLSNGKLTSI